jgi:O-antigen ligase
MQQDVIGSKWFAFLSFFMLLVTTALFAYTGKYILLVAPVAFLFILLMMLNWKLAYWILLFSVPFSMDIDLASGSLSTSIPDEPIVWLFLLLFALIWARKPSILPEWWWRNSIVLVVVLQFVWLLVAVAFSTELFLSIKFLLAKIWLMVAFFIFPLFIFREKKDFKNAFMLLLVPIMMTMVIILYRHYKIGFSFIKIQRAIDPLYYNHVDYSTVMSMFLPLLFIAYSLNRGKWLIRNLLILIILFFLVAIYLTYARAAMVAVGFSAVVYLAIRLKLVNWIMPFIYGLITLLLVFMISNKQYMEYHTNYNKTYMHKTFAEHMIATLRGRDMSSMERIYRWIAAVRMSTDRPVTGYGPNAFYYNYKPYAVTSFRTYVSRNTEKSTTHNYFLYMLTEQGWPAMLLYAVLIALLFAKAQKIYYRFHDRFYKKVTLGVAMLIAAAFINNFFSELYETHKVGALFYICVALLVVLEKKSKDEEEQRKIKALQ